MNTTARAFADEATALSKATLPQITAYFCSATLLVTTLYALAHAAHVA